MEPVAARLHVLFAREARNAVIIRRGPTKQARLIVWDTETGVFTPGQWLKARVYERRCDLSPDGTKLIYFAYDGHADRPTLGSYTAISRPPYFSPIVIWPKGDTARGGGMFLDGMTVWLNGDHKPSLKAVSPRLRVTRDNPSADSGSAECLGVYFPRLRRDGWTRAGEENGEGTSHVKWEKARGKLKVCKRVTSTEGSSQPGQGALFDEHDVTEDGATTSITLPNAEWADFDRRGRLFFASAGKLWRADMEAGELKTRELKDFNDMVFENVPPPKAATRWDEQVAAARTFQPRRGGGRGHRR